MVKRVFLVPVWLAFAVSPVLADECFTLRVQIDPETERRLHDCLTSAPRGARLLGIEQPENAHLTTARRSILLTESESEFASAREEGSAAPALRPLLTLAPEASAQEGPSKAPEETPKPSDLSISLGARGWFSTGTTVFQASGPGINILSELKWHATEAIVPELSADLVWKRLVLAVSGGGGSITDGVLFDNDFSQPDRSGRFSYTRSQVSDQGLWYLNGDIGFRFGTWRVEKDAPAAYVDALLGYQYWHEKYEAFGANGFCQIPAICGPPSTVVPRNVKVITEDYTWQSLRVGIRYYVPFPKRFGLKVRLLVLPWSYSYLQDVHHLRPDFRKNPSVSATAQGGIGTQLDGAVTWSPWRWLSLEAGFQYWLIDAGSGERRTYTVSGTIKDNTNDTKTERYGPFVGIQARW